MEQYKEMVRTHFEEVVSNAKVELIDTLYAENFVGHVMDSSMEINGTEQYKQFITLRLMHIPDLRITVLDQVAEGDRVASRWKAEVVSPANEQEKKAIHGMSFHRFAGGLIVESWETWDSLTAMQTLGVNLLESASMNM